MFRRWVVNASPIISLSKIGRTSLLLNLCDELIIPSGVDHEIKQGADDDPAKCWLKESGVKHVKDVGPIAPAIAAWDLGLGETEVINWAYIGTLDGRVFWTTEPQGIVRFLLEFAFGAPSA